jgi:RHH-type proline utilization regulon transcriptional repressor/proline dehydrogenase/delta 1-pyrroline-5-carboxylate dehydrogenase
MIEDNADNRALAAHLPDAVTSPIEWIDAGEARPAIAQVLIEHAMPGCVELLGRIASADGPIPMVQVGSRRGEYRLDWMVEEVATSIDTTAAGGNASLMALV